MLTNGPMSNVVGANLGGRVTTTFGIVTDQNQPYDVLVDRWKMFESLGFDSLWDTDHFNQPSQPTGPLFEGWTLLAALAVHTTQVRIGVPLRCTVQAPHCAIPQPNLVPVSPA